MQHLHFAAYRAQHIMLCEARERSCRVEFILVMLHLLS